MGKTSRKPFRPTGLFLGAVALVCAASASAQTLYKLIDKNGKVTYSEEAPKNFDGKVIRMDIDPNANTATLPKPAQRAKSLEGTSDGPPKASEAAKPTRAQELAAAREKLDAAKRALADARDNPREGDVTWIGNKSGGTRPIPTEDHAKRLADLEERVREAEANVRRLE